MNATQPCRAWGEKALGEAFDRPPVQRVLNWVGRRGITFSLARAAAEESNTRVSPNYTKERGLNLAQKKGRCLACSDCARSPLRSGLRFCRHLARDAGETGGEESGGGDAEYGSRGAGRATGRRGQVKRAVIRGGR